MSSATQLEYLNKQRIDRLVYLILSNNNRMSKLKMLNSGNKQREKIRKYVVGDSQFLKIRLTEAELYRIINTVLYSI